MPLRLAATPATDHSGSQACHNFLQAYPLTESPMTRPLAATLSEGGLLLPRIPPDLPPSTWGIPFPKKAHLGPYSPRGGRGAVLISASRKLCVFFLSLIGFVVVPQVLANSWRPHPHRCTNLPPAFGAVASWPCSSLNALPLHSAACRKTSECAAQKASGYPRKSALEDGVFCDLPCRFSRARGSSQKTPGGASGFQHSSRVTATSDHSFSSPPPLDPAVVPVLAPAADGATSTAADIAALDAASAAALTELHQELDALESSPGPYAVERVVTALRILQELTLKLQQEGGRRAVSKCLLTEFQRLLLRLTGLFRLWEEEIVHQGETPQEPPSNRDSSGLRETSPSNLHLVLLRITWHVASAYLEAAMQLQEQQQQQQRLLQLLLKRHAGDPSLAMLLAEDLVLLQRQRSTSLSSFAARVAVATSRAAEAHRMQPTPLPQDLELHLQRLQQLQQHARWDAVRWLETHGVSTDEAQAVAAALLQQGVQAEAVCRVVTSLLCLEKTQQRSSCWAEGPSLSAPHFGVHAGAIEETQANKAGQACYLGKAIHLLLARAFADEGSSAAAHSQLLLAHTSLSTALQQSNYTAPWGEEDSLSVGGQRETVAAALAVAVASMKDGELEKASDALRLLPSRVALRFSSAVLPVALELSRRLLFRGRQLDAPPDISVASGSFQGAPLEAIFTQQFEHVLSTVGAALLQGEKCEEVAAEAVELSELIMAIWHSSTASGQLSVAVSKFLNIVTRHLKGLLSPSPTCVPILSLHQERLLTATAKTLYGGMREHQTQGGELLSLVEAADRGHEGEEAGGSKVEGEELGRKGTRLWHHALAAAFQGLAAAAQRLLRQAKAMKADAAGALADITATEAAHAADSGAGGDSSAAAAILSTEAGRLVGLVHSLQALSRNAAVPIGIEETIAIGRVLHAASLLGVVPEEKLVPVSPLLVPAASSLQLHRRGIGTTPASQRQQQHIRQPAGVIERSEELLALLRRQQQMGNAEAALMLLRRQTALAEAAETLLDNVGTTRGGVDREGRTEEGGENVRREWGDKSARLLNFFAAKPTPDCFYFAAAAAAAAARPDLAFEVLTLENKAVGATSTRTSNAAIKACVAVLSEASTKPLPLVHASSSALSHRVPSVAPSGSRLAGCFASPPAPDPIAPSAPTDPAFLSTSASCQSVEELQRVATAGFGVYTQLRCIQQQLQQTKEQILRQYTPWVHGEAMRTSLLQQDYAGALNMFEALLRLRRQLHRDLSQLLLQEQPSQQHQELLMQREYGRVLLPPLPCGVLDVALRALESSLLAGQPPVWASPSPASVPYFSSHFRPRRQLAQLANGNIASAAILERYLRVQDAPSVRSPTGTASTVTADGTGANLSAIAHAKMRLANAKSPEAWCAEYEELQKAHKLWRGDEEHIAKLLARRFGGIEALKIVHRQLQGQKHQPERQQVQEEEHHEQQWSFHESPLNSLHDIRVEPLDTPANPSALPTLSVYTRTPGEDRLCTRCSQPLPMVDLSVEI
ncbi:hypothetical protein cyc_02859 [Cyclospora cayetanensis]|uniref:Uncharacterized protein n=1 Tax=Cyclospora cayetanensis TaxID=88456 RepID=A0A1D3D6K0_9EIME|nr:hypothetical protein cyc_02859 [Cyclospora cayetanensis]